MLLVLLLACAADPPAAPPPAPTPVTAPPTTPDPAHDEAIGGPNGGARYLAKDGSLYTDKLFLGVLALEQSELALSPEQAREVLAALDKLEAKLRKNQFYDDQIDRICTPAQLAVMDANAHLSQDEMKARFNPPAMTHVVEDLAARAGLPRPTDEVAVPAEVGAYKRKQTVSRMTTFIVAYDQIQADASVAFSKEQAGDLLPYVDSYVRLKSMKQQTKRDVGAALTDAQRAWIDAHPPADMSIREMTQLAAELRAAMETKAGA